MTNLPARPPMLPASVYPRDSHRQTEQLRRPQSAVARLRRRPVRPPVSLANAFVKPVAPRGDESLVEKSIAALDDYYGQIVKMYGDGGLKEIRCLPNGSYATLSPERRCWLR